MISYIIGGVLFIIFALFYIKNMNGLVTVRDAFYIFIMSFFSWLSVLICGIAALSIIYEKYSDKKLF
jgi:hypothetical protein